MEAKVMPKGFQESAREKASSTQKAPIALGPSLPLTWNAGMKDGAPAAIFNHGGSHEPGSSVLRMAEQPHRGAPAADETLELPHDPQLLLEKIIPECFCHRSQRSVTSSHVQFLMDSLSEKP